MTDTQYLYQYFLEQSKEETSGSQGVRDGESTAAFKTADVEKMPKKEAQNG